MEFWSESQRKLKKKGPKKEPEKELNLPCKQLRNSKNTGNCFWCFSIKQSASERKVYLKYMNLVKNEEIGQYFFLCEGHHLFLYFIYEICIQVLSDNILRTLVTSPTYLPSALKCLFCSLLTKLLFLGRKVGGGVRVEGLEGCDRGSSSQRLFSYCYFC